MEQDESGPEDFKRWGENTAFVVIPTEDPVYPANFENLGRAERIAVMEGARADLDARIRQRIPDYEVEFLSGASTWVVRTDSPIPIVTLRQKLAGLPVQVADETHYVAL